MERRPTVPAGLTEDIHNRLESLIGTAETLQAKAERAFLSRDFMRPLVREREALKQQLSAANSQIQRAATEPPEELVRTADRIGKRIAVCNGKIETALGPFTEFSADLTRFISQLRSTLRLLPPSREKEVIEKLPLLTRGLGSDCSDTQDDLSAIQMRLSKFTKHLTGRKSLRIEIPAGTTWENIHIRFLSPETVEITAPDLVKHFNYAELGFEDRRQHAPRKAWLFLHILALAQDNEISRPIHKPATVEKNVQALRERLRNFFGLRDDPFFRFREVRCYRPRFKLSSLSDQG